ncbi:response regulator transcription factor [Hymenobacter sp. BT664]|uniref:Response regulator transcription factor n=1 Tax=Hymenobacter montanus TaxID=2771359 RepID=A0A927GK03_9BACT|nr:LytTR family DNA-binding domain-containing protein [Hymenobacter montanus]MBD2768684.1 response regulator transcription factor [Hymenobacter montanus]
MTPLSCLIVDDEPLAQEVLQTYVAHTPGLVLVGTCAHAPAALAALRQQPVDLLFLDIEMPLLNGLEFLRSLAQPPAVIFTTAYREYAVEGFELAAVDYLVKPVSFPRFTQAVNRVLHRLPGGAVAPAAPVAAPAKPEAGIFLRVDKRLVKVALADILYLESLKDYVRVHTRTGPLVTYHTLQGLADQLPADRFVRVHKSYLVALEHVRAIEGNVLEVGGAHITLSRLNREEVWARLRQSGIWGLR